MFVYKVTNRVNGMAYIGITVRPVPAAAKECGISRDLMFDLIHDRRGIMTRLNERIANERSHGHV